MRVSTHIKHAVVPNEIQAPTSNHEPKQNEDSNRQNGGIGKTSSKSTNEDEEETESHEIGNALNKQWSDICVHHTNARVLWKVCAEEEIKCILLGAIQEVICDVSCAGVPEILESTSFRPLSCSCEIGLQGPSSRVGL
jgi:hypothetical protein